MKYIVNEENVSNAMLLSRLLVAVAILTCAFFKLPFVLDTITGSTTLFSKCIITILFFCNLLLAIMVVLGTYTRLAVFFIIVLSSPSLYIFFDNITPYVLLGLVFFIASTIPILYLGAGKISSDFRKYRSL